MRRHWQREPLLVRGALRGFRDPLSPREVLALARSPHAMSRLVRRRGASWSLEHGPFTAARFKQLPRRGWTVLVQDTNHFSPRDDELVAAFLDFLRDRPGPAGRYADAGAPPASHPGEVPTRLLRHIERTVDAITWTAADVRAFAGVHLSEPKPQVSFTPRGRALGLAACRKRCRTHGIALDPRTRLLYSGSMFFLNGERLDVPASARARLRRLADERRLNAPAAARAAFWRLAHAAYLRGTM